MFFFQVLPGRGPLYKKWRTGSTGFAFGSRRSPKPALHNRLSSRLLLRDLRHDLVHGHHDRLVHGLGQDQPATILSSDYVNFNARLRMGDSGITHHCGNSCTPGKKWWLSSFNTSTGWFPTVAPWESVLPNIGFLVFLWMFTTEGASDYQFKAG